MIRSRFLRCVAVLICCAPAGCGMFRKSGGDLQKPPRATELDSYAPFVGSWTWKAVMHPRDGATQQWEGTAEWKWILDQRFLSGRMSAKSGETAFDAEGLWGYSTRAGRHFWGMANNWGYAQKGAARYSASDRKWVMTYRSTGLDGTTSHGRYTLTFIDADTIDWRMTEWADRLHLVRKMDMHGTYSRRR